MCSVLQCQYEGLFPDRSPMTLHFKTILKAFSDSVYRFLIFASPYKDENSASLMIRSHLWRRIIALLPHNVLYFSPIAGIFYSHGLLAAIVFNSPDSYLYNFLPELVYTLTHCFPPSNFHRFSLWCSVHPFLPISFPEIPFSWDFF